jgi:hypothetical protein
VQRALLEDEGVQFDPHGRLDLERYRWHPTPSVLPDTSLFPTSP